MSKVGCELNSLLLFSRVRTNLF